MRTFDMTAELDFQVQIPEKFLTDMREACQAEDASEFLKQAHAMHPTDDDEFLLMILRNGFKHQLRHTAIQMCEKSGIGGTFSPTKLRDRTPPVGTTPVLATEVNQAIL